MFAMLTGNLPFTVQPFTIKALYAKMIAGDMNALPEYLSNSTCVTLSFTRLAVIRFVHNLHNFNHFAI